MADYRKYSVRAGMSGRMTVDVPLAAIKLRGERNAVLDYAWRKLLGEDDILGKVDKSLQTRKFIFTEMFSRYSHERGDVFRIFCAKVKYYPMHNVIR